MSELSNLMRQTEALGMWLEQSEENGGSCKALLDKEKECADVRMRLSKLLVKSGKLDPISHLPRFGAQAVEKIRGALAKSEKLHDILTNLSCDAREKEERERERELLELQRRSKQEESCADSYAMETFPSSEMEMAKDLIKFEEERRNLSVVAEQVRRARASAKAELQEVLQTLNNSPKGTSEFTTIVENLSVGARQFLGDMLSRILANPNDERLRRLRLSHPRVWAAFTKHAAALPALAQLGFEACVEANTDEGAEVASLSLSEGEDLPRRLLQLSVSSRSNITFTMAEPSVEEDSTSWIKWYDDLTAQLAACTGAS
jgi:hypothetical protein